MAKVILQCWPVGEVIHCSIMGPSPGTPIEQKSCGNRQRENLLAAPATTVVLSDAPPSSITTVGVRICRWPWITLTSD